MHFAIAEKGAGRIHRFLRDARVISVNPGRKKSMWIRYFDEDSGRDCEIGLSEDVFDILRTVGERPESGRLSDVEPAPTFDPGDGPVPVDGDEAIEDAVEAYIERQYPLRKQNRILFEKLAGGKSSDFDAMSAAISEARVRAEAAKVELGDAKKKNETEK